MKRVKRRHLRSTSLLIIPMVTISLLQPTVFAHEPPVTVISGSGVAQSVSGNPQVQQPNPADVKFTQEQAIAKLRELFPVLKDAEVQSVELGIHNQFPPPENQMVWTIQWMYRTGNGGYGFSSQVDAIKGDLISTSLYGPLLNENEVYYPPKMSREEAAAKAKEFIKKAITSVNLEQLTVRDGDQFFQNRPLFGPVRYSFSFEPTINGISVPEAAIRIEMDGEGNIYQFYRSNESVQYPSGQPKLTAEEAKNKIDSNTDMTLRYIPVRKGNGISWFLGWQGEFPLLDAQTGEFLDYNGAASSSLKVSYKDMPETEKKFVPANPARGQLTAEEAVAIVQKYVTIPQDRQLMSKTLGTYQGKWSSLSSDRQVWSFSWRNPEEQRFGPWGETFAAVDAKTGQILEYREERFAGLPFKEQNPGNQTPVSLDSAKQKALNLVAELYPDAKTELKMLEKDGANAIPNGYQFTFQRFYQGLPVQEDVMNVSLDLSGKILSFYTNRTTDLENKLKGLSAKVSKEQAAAKYKTDIEIKLQYQTFRFPDPSGKTKSTTKLVYRTTLKDLMYPNYLIDAQTGEWKSAWEPSPPAQNGTKEATDIDGHWAKESLSTLVKYGILTVDADGKVNPDSEITGGQWLQMMVKAVNPNYDREYYGDTKPALEEVPKDSPYFIAVNYALRARWLDSKDKNLKLDQPLTREELAASLTRILQYDKLTAFLNSNVSVPYSDIDQVQAKGAVMIAQRLGLMQGSDGYFRPTEKVTKAQAASVMMRLVYMQGKTDQQVNGNYYY